MFETNVWRSEATINYTLVITSVADPDPTVFSGTGPELISRMKKYGIPSLTYTGEFFLDISNR